MGLEVFTEYLLGPFVGPSVPWIGWLIVFAVLALIARFISRSDADNDREGLVLSIILVIAFVASPIIAFVIR